MSNRSDQLFLGAAFISLVFSILLWFGVLGPNQKEAGIFVGLWVPSILTLAAFYKIKAQKT